MSKVAVYIEMKEGEVRKQVFEVLTFAHRGGSDVCGIVLEGDAEGWKGMLKAARGRWKNTESQVLSR